MGMDLYELVLRIEDDFGIDITNEEAATVVTVEDLWRIVAGKVKPRRCATSAAFYSIRRGFMETTRCARAEIRPGTPLEALLPWRRRGRLWNDLGRRMNRPLPRLEYSWPVEWLLILSGFATAAVTARMLPNSFLNPAVVLILGMLMGFSLRGIARPLATQFPPGLASVGDLARSAAPIEGTDLWEAYRRIVADQLGLAVDDITPSASFVDDLRVD